MVGGSVLQYQITISIQDVLQLGTEWRNEKGKGRRATSHVCCAADSNNALKRKCKRRTSSLEKQKTSSEHSSLGARRII